MLSSALANRFSAGLDLDILLSKSGEEIREFLQELYINLFDAQYHLSKPSIAVVNGAARGGGMTMAVSCDIVLASDSATFGYPEIDVGVLPAIHYVHLPRLIGRHRAFELLFSGRAFGADEAYELGIVNKVVADADIDDAAMQMAAQFAAKSETVVRLGRAAFMRQIDDGYRRSIASAVDDFCIVAVTDEAQKKTPRLCREAGVRPARPLRLDRVGIPATSAQFADLDAGFLDHLGVTLRVFGDQRR